MVDEVTQNISGEVRAAIRKEAVQQTAKWAIGAVVFLIGIALTGWWLFLEPKLRDYIANAAGGVPLGAVVASTTECKSLTGKWINFTEGTGRFLVGAGDEKHKAYGTWDMALPQGGVQPSDISTYSVMAKGGEEKHLLGVNEMPAHAHEMTLNRKWGDKSNQETGWGSDDGTHPASTVSTAPTGGNLAHNTLPPYIALYLCKKA